MSTKTALSIFIVLISLPTISLYAAEPSMEVISIEPASPAVLEPGQRLYVKFRYNAGDARVIQTWVRPEGSARGCKSHPCGAITNKEGVYEGWFFFDQNAAEIKSIRIAMKESGKKGYICETSVPVDIKWKAPNDQWPRGYAIPGSSLQIISTEPASPAVLKPGEEFKIKFRFDAGDAKAINIQSWPNNANICFPAGKKYDLKGSDGSVGEYEYSLVKSKADTAKRVKIRIVNADTERVVLEKSFPIDVTWGKPKQLNTPNKLEAFRITAQQNAKLIEKRFQETIKSVLWNGDTTTPINQDKVQVLEKELCPLDFYPRGLSFTPKGRLAAAIGNGTTPNMEIGYLDDGVIDEAVVDIRYRKMKEEREKFERQGYFWFFAGPLAFDKSGICYFNLGSCGPNGIYKVNSNNPVDIEKIYKTGSANSLQIPPFDSENLYLTTHSGIYRYPLIPTESYRAKPWFQVKGENILLVKSLVLSPTEVIVKILFEKEHLRTFYFNKETNSYAMLSTMMSKRDIGPMAMSWDGGKLVALKSSPRSLVEFSFDRKTKVVTAPALPKTASGQFDLIDGQIGEVGKINTAGVEDVYGGEDQYDPKLLLGKLKKYSIIQLADRRVTRSVKNVPLIKIRAAYESETIKGGTIGWVKLASTTFANKEIVVESAKSKKAYSGYVKPELLSLSDEALMALDYTRRAKAKIVAKRDTPGPGVEFDIYYPPNEHSFRLVSSRRYGKGVLTDVDVNKYIAYELKYSVVGYKCSTPVADNVRIAFGSYIGGGGSYRPEGVNLPEGESIVASTIIQPGKMSRCEFIGFVAYMFDSNFKNTEGITITLKLEATPGAHQLEPREKPVAIVQNINPSKVRQEKYRNKNTEEQFDLMDSQVAKKYAGIYEGVWTYKSKSARAGESKTIILKGKRDRTGNLGFSFIHQDVYAEPVFVKSSVDQYRANVYFKLNNNQTIMYSLARDGQILDGPVYSSFKDEAKVSLQQLTLSQAIEAIEGDYSRIASLEKTIKNTQIEAAKQKSKYLSQTKEFQKNVEKFMEETRSLEAKNKRLKEEYLRVIKENQNILEQIRAVHQKLTTQLTEAKKTSQKAEQACKAEINKLNSTITKLERENRSHVREIERLKKAQKLPALFMKDILRYNNPEGFYTRVIAENPGSPLALVAQAGIVFIHLANGNDEQVIVEYDKLLAEYKGLPKYGHHTYIIPQEYYDIAKAAKQQGLNEKGEAYYKKAITLWEKVDLKDINAFLGGATLYTLGNSCHFSGDSRKGMEYYERLIKEYPNSDYIYSARYFLPGCVRALKKKDPSFAQEADVLTEKYLNELVNNHPDRRYYQQSLKKLAMFYFEKEQYEKALHRFEQYVEKYPKEHDRCAKMMSDCRKQLAETKEKQNEGQQKKEECKN